MMGKPGQTCSEDADSGDVETGRQCFTIFIFDTHELPVDATHLYSCFDVERNHVRVCPRLGGACRALTDLQRATQGEHVPAECLSTNEKKAAFSFYSSLM